MYLDAYIDTPNGKHDSYTLSYFVGPKRVRKKFSDLAKAREEANAAATKLRSGEINILSLGDAERFAYARAVDALQPTGVPLEIAALQFAEAHKKLNGASLLEAVEYYARRNPHSRPRKSISEIRAEMLDAKAKVGVSEIYLEQLGLMLRKFSETFCCSVSDVTNQWHSGAADVREAASGRSWFCFAPNGK